MDNLSKTTGKFDLQKIINDVRSMISPATIPEANKNDPIGYHLSELNKHTKNLAENQAIQADLIAKMSDTLGALYQEIHKKQEPSAASSVPPTTPTA